MTRARFQAEPTGSIPIVREAHGRAGKWNHCFELTTGGMATVYLSYAAGPMGVGKLAAVKVIQPHLAKEREYVEMFLDEARIASLIQHPNVCATYELGETGRTYFIAMEYLHGEPLGALRRALAERTDDSSVRERCLLAARIVADAAEGLHAAHELRDPATGSLMNVIHRDVSPQNIFVTYDGAVRVLDFGIARAAGRLHTTAPGIVKGKFAYMAPEQMKDRDVDRRADLWSLGVILWELVARERLFHRRTDAAIAQAVTREPIASLVEVCPQAPPALVRVVDRALQRDPDARYATARDMSSDLTAFLSEVAQPMGIAQVSKWMDGAFARRKRQKDEMVRMAFARGRAATDQVADDSEELTKTRIESLRIFIEVDDASREETPNAPAPTPTPRVAQSAAAPGAYASLPAQTLVAGAGVLLAIIGFAVLGGTGPEAANPSITPPVATDAAVETDVDASVARPPPVAAAASDAGLDAGPPSAVEDDTSSPVPSTEPEAGAGGARRHRRHRGVGVATIPGSEPPATSSAEAPPPSTPPSTDTAEPSSPPPDPPPAEAPASTTAEPSGATP